MNKMQGTTLNKALLTKPRLQRNALSNSLSQVLEDRHHAWEMRETTSMRHDYIPYRNKLASSLVCVLVHSSHQVRSLLTPLNLQSSTFKPHNYARHADSLAQYLEFSTYHQRIQHSMTPVSASALSSATSTSRITTKVPTPCSTLFASVVVLTGLC